ncbi:hypothetical protein Tcan_09601 [Toxocara canis]|uniref:Uncharacterized protein n=1 Tax=Toxocara canis TaxID=6265 RepID=A0A0B2V8C4_TOXCA|nr:hypothetical protein Tcan_09601 [Toxocara canis]
MIRSDVYTALFGCCELRIAKDGKTASCIDGEDDGIDEITAVQGIQDGMIRSDVYTALFGCCELRIAKDGKTASCIDGEDDGIDEITAVQGIQDKEWYEGMIARGLGTLHTSIQNRSGRIYERRKRKVESVLAALISQRSILQ